MIGRQLGFLSLSIWVILRILLFIAALPKQEELEDLLRNEIFKPLNQRQDRFVSTVKEKQYYLIRGFLLFSMIIVSTFIIPPIVSNANVNIPLWTPFDGKREDVAVFVYESCCFVMLSCFYPIMDCNFIGFINIVSAQINLLKDNLEYSTDRDVEDDYTKHERKIQERLGRCIIHHIAILK